ncbi:hypothetical protein LTR09_007645 [Extremus antarcticus]|uniref:Uncharacterized protein n=1 Tax=Extremus antarcticus TaxID=702011 RepID=A0AAJ0G7L9_9PEZI|nr:hypothetical protein LTR09_007645 [Extremus antarcticus]
MYDLLALAINAFAVAYRNNDGTKAELRRLGLEVERMLFRKRREREERKQQDYEDAERAESRRRRRACRRRC